MLPPLDDSKILRSHILDGPKQKQQRRTQMAILSRNYPYQIVIGTGIGNNWNIALNMGTLYQFEILSPNYFTASSTNLYNIEVRNSINCPFLQRYSVFSKRLGKMFCFIWHIYMGSLPRVRANNCANEDIIDRYLRKNIYYFKRKGTVGLQNKIRIR